MLLLNDKLEQTHLPCACARIHLTKHYLYVTYAVNKLHVKAVHANTFDLGARQESTDHDTYLINYTHLFYNAILIALVYFDTTECFTVLRNSTMPTLSVQWSSFIVITALQIRVWADARHCATYKTMLQQNDVRAATCIGTSEWSDQRRDCVRFLNR